VEQFPALTPQLVPRIAALLGTMAVAEPFRAGGEAVFALTLPAEGLDVDLVLILWPGIHRVDVRLGASSMVFKQIDSVELYPGVEVLFRRQQPPGYLFVSIGGRASMVG
jgi:hypothetical protein